jgi:hypothetical protein
MFEIGARCPCFGLAYRVVGVWLLAILLVPLPARSQESDYGFDLVHDYCALEAKTDSVSVLSAVYFEDLLDTWPSKKIPYVVDATIQAKPQLTLAVRAAADHINKRAVVNLYEVSIDQAKKLPGYIRVVGQTVKKNGRSFDCATFNSRYSPGENLMWVGGGGKNFCDEASAPRIVHEFLHAIGLRHEQKHKFRDRYITIISANLKDLDAKAQWGVTPRDVKQLKASTDAGLPYDFTSIMHYSDTQGVVSAKKPAFTVVDPDGVKLLSKIRETEPDFTIGQRNCISDQDAAAVNFLYEDVK